MRSAASIEICRTWLAAEFGQDYSRLKRLVPTDDPPGWIIALASDAE